MGRGRGIGRRRTNQIRSVKGTTGLLELECIVSRLDIKHPGPYIYDLSNVHEYSFPLDNLINYHMLA
jgi:hypothetical protein